MCGEGEGKRKIGVKDTWGEGKEEGEGKSEEKEKGEGREKGKKEDSNGDREGKKDIYRFPHIHARALSSCGLIWISVCICIMFSESSLIVASKNLLSLSPHEPTGQL